MIKGHIATESAWTISILKKVGAIDGGAEKILFVTANFDMSTDSATAFDLEIASGSIGNSVRKIIAKVAVESIPP